MTRVLSELLGAKEPMFGQGLRQLESLSGHPGADIRLSSRLQQETRQKIHELGLDTADTTGHELYAALGERLRRDEDHFITAVTAAGQDLSAGIAHALLQHIPQRTAFALRLAVARKLLKANLPKRTMKLLGYRSADSMLKHESPANLIVAAQLLESAAWKKRLAAQYSKLQSNDFESRDIVIEHPATARWTNLAATALVANRQTVRTSTELGAVVLLPVATRPRLVGLMTAGLTIQAINDIRAAGTFLKLQQLQPDFGRMVQQVMQSEPMLPAATIDQPVSWHALHQYFARFEGSLHTTMFEPVVAAEELAWTGVEHTLARIVPALSFWERTAYLALLDVRPQAAAAVSCNLLDLLVSHANGLSYEQRTAQYFKKALSSELLLSYLNHDKLEQTFFAGVHGTLAPEMAT